MRNLYFKIYDYVFKDIKNITLCPEYSSAFNEQTITFIVSGCLHENSKIADFIWYGISNELPMLMTQLRINIPIKQLRLMYEYSLLDNPISLNSSHFYDEVKYLLGKFIYQKLKNNNKHAILQISYGYAINILLKVRSLDELMIKLDLE